MNYIEWFGTNFIGLFEAGGKQFVSFMTGIVPLLIVLLTFTYSIIAFIGRNESTEQSNFSQEHDFALYLNARFIRTDANKSNGLYIRSFC